jgi:hypothetical protein
MHIQPNILGVILSVLFVQVLRTVGDTGQSQFYAGDGP